MSFILDALRKSESERRHGAVPGITEVPLALQPHALPAWAVAVMIALGLGVLALAAAWWMNVQPRPEAQVATTAPQSTEPSPATPVPRAPASSASSNLADAVRSAARPGPVDRATALERSAQASADSAPALPPSRSTGQGPATATGPSAAVATGRADRLPNAAALVAEGVNVPDLKLQLHVYDERAPSRYVFINGNMYREGDTLREGPRLLRIERSGAVLSHAGREFVLAQ